MQIGNLNKFFLAKEWWWIKTYHIITRDNFAPNLQHRIHCSKYFWRTGLVCKYLKLVFNITQHSFCIQYDTHTNDVLVRYSNTVFSMVRQIMWLLRWEQMRLQNCYDVEFICFGLWNRFSGKPIFFDAATITW